ncbi:zinc finger MYM-type protein 5 isoform X2 [Nycticebus coucang]|uniref:zinc finger MYM-type protein 5 isoform X2 n=1 Tax=Nycticebus coucang TaxID=9470 RepID=UPI00234C26CE|nr:zinc finger MYM-type protein 5 isoform X2 [Nycticebus coucang]
MSQVPSGAAQRSRNHLQANIVKIWQKLKRRTSPLFFGMDKCSVGGLELTEQTPALLGSTAMTTSLVDLGDSFGDPTSQLVRRSGNSSVEDDDDVVFIESIQPPSISAPIIADQRSFIFASSNNEKPQGSDSIILPSSRDLASQKGNISETIVIDDEEDIETHGKEEKSSSFIEWELPETENRTKDLDFSTSGLSRSKTKTGVGPFNPGRVNVTGDVFQNGESATHSPEMHLQRRLLFLWWNQANPSKNFVVHLFCLPVKTTRILKREFLINQDV